MSTNKQTTPAKIITYSSSNPEIRRISNSVRLIAAGLVAQKKAKISEGDGANKKYLH